MRYQNICHSAMEYKKKYSIAEWHIFYKNKINHKYYESDDQKEGSPKVGLLGFLLFLSFCTHVKS